MNEVEEKTPFLSNRTYDFLVYAVQYILPALGTLYFTLAALWGLPNAEQVVGTIVALTAFLAVILAFGRRSYKQSDARFDGELVVDTTNPERDLFSYNVTRPLDDLRDLDEITLKVHTE